MPKPAAKPVKRAPLTARPQPVHDRKALRAELSKRHSKTLEHLAK